MKILIVNNMAPFIWGGAEELAINLEQQLIKTGHDAEVLRIPFQWEPAEAIPSQMLMVENLVLRNIDRVIALKFPAYLINHPQKTYWLLHQYRQAYDLFDAGQSNIPNNETGVELRHIIKQADNKVFQTARSIFTISPIITKRLSHYNEINSEILYQPLNYSELFTNKNYQGYIFAGGRINNMKRQHLLVEAMKYTNKNVKLIIAGPPDNTAYKESIENLVKDLELSDRIILNLNFLPRQQIADYVNNALACACVPFDEDSLSYVAMEAANASKAVITTADSGGILNLVKDNETGWIVPPDPKELAEVMDNIFFDQNSAILKGKAMFNYWKGLDINWENTLEKLLS